MGRPAKNLIGQKFGRLMVLERDMSKPSGAGKSAYWLCQCNCGNIASIRSDKLTNNITQSCGCLSKEIHSQLFLKNLTGQRFGKLTVLKRDMSKPIGENCPAYWICKCDCGSITSVRSDHLRDGTIIGCGCANSKGELKLRQIFDNYSIQYKAQYSFPDLQGDSGTVLRFDFALFYQNNILCLIEYQGEQHFKLTYSWDTEERLERRQRYDKKKKQYCQQHNIPFYEILFSDYNYLNFDWIQNQIPEIKEAQIR